MFRCLWLRAPRDVPLSTRLYRSFDGRPTYGRTYGRRLSETDQPVTLPQDLRLSDAPAPLVPIGESDLAASAAGNAGHKAA
ncbi:MAG: hypothetical protein ACOY82_15340 [Pseudomonadota bacterium]